ncbi:ROK family protein [Marinivivus vitaminiproducens]|uniref:ROK family transcriptional regulator n=1 Tax=Marinivivus vitaminiproducens TaxID=3035935 RepID=UPI0027A0A16C|nr:ROK family transcriptional regulator [Geminicoccaceae bacterium SCSIO 64248]
MARKGSNSVQVRHYNERVVLEAVRRLGQASKADIARAAHLTPQAVAGIVDALSEAGYLEVRGKRFGKVGQPSVLYGPAPDRAFAIGLHIGRRSLESVLVNFAGEIQQARVHDYAAPEPDRVLRRALEDMAALTTSLRPEWRGRVIGAGVAMPHFLHGWQGELGFSDVLVERWRAIDLKAELAERSPLPILFEKDAAAAATAELVHGIGRSHASFLYLSINTFIGGGLVLDGGVETGTHGNAAAIAPMPVGPSGLAGVPAPDAPFELLLRRASVYVLLRHLRANGIAVERARDLAGLPDAARPFVAEWQEDCSRALAQALVAATSVVDVEAVVIDGVLPRAMLEQVVRAVAESFALLLPEGIVAPRVLAGTLGRDATAIGAAMLPLYAVFAPDSAVLAKRLQAERRAPMAANLT